jgi:hypothetical protein
MGTAVEANVDFNVNDQWSSIRALLERLARLHDSALTEPGALDLSRCAYLGPDAAAILGALIIERRIRNQPLAVKPPQGPAELSSFWVRSGLANLAAPGSTPEAATTGPGNVLPIRQVLEARFQDADPIINLIHEHTETPDDEADEYLRICVNEVIQNMQDHSKSSIGGVVSARFMAKAGQVRVAIVDHGVGICESLKARFPDTTPELALHRVRQGLYSAMSRPNNRGSGIRNLCDIVVRNRGGDIFIVSDRAVAQWGPRKTWNVQSLPFRFPGTGAFFSVPMRT